MKNKRPALNAIAAGCRALVAVGLAASFAVAPAPVLAQIAGAAQNGNAPPAGQANLNFVGADIEMVIKAIGHLTGRTFIIDPRVKGTINLVSEKPVTKQQAFNLLTSALRLLGYAVVEVDGYTKVVPEPDAKLQAGPTQVGKLGGDQVATRIFRLNYESAANMLSVLRPLISPNNTISANPGSNSLVITDYADNLSRLEKIIAAMDAPASADLDVVPIKHAIASDLATLVNRMMEPQAGGAADSGRVSLLADVRTNSLIIRAPSAARANLARAIIFKLDQPTAQPGNVHVVYLKNADAVKLAQTLRAVVAGEAGGAASSPQAAPTPTQNTPQQGGQNQSGLGSVPSLGGNSQQNLPSGGAGGYIQADAATNSLIITASETQYRNLRAVIDQLDARRVQVYIEALIVEVTATRAAELGVQWLAATGDSTSTYRLGGGTAFNSGGNNLFTQAASKLSSTNTLAAPGNGLTLGLFRQINGALGLGALAHALETNGNANILSTPNLVTLDNEEAKLLVGQNVPFITGQYTTAASAGAAGVNPFQTVERRDIGLKLTVRPQVSEGGTVKLAIYQESSSIDSQTNTAGIITKQRSIQTNVLVDDGQIIVLGGLIEDNVNGGEEKVPLLGDIPVIGNLFKYGKRERTKTNLMVFLRPIVIRTAEQSASVVADRYDYMRGAEQASPSTSILLPEIVAPQLPPLQNGAPVGGGMIERKAPAPVQGAQSKPEPSGKP